MRFDARSAAVMRKASRGPAAIALRQQRLLPGGKFLAVNPSGGALTRGGSFGTLRRGPHLGALGAESAGAAVGSAVASKGAAAGASSLATYIGAGSLAGPIGLVVGAIVGIVLTKILNKQYLNVAQANQIAEAAVSVFNQYKGIAGQVAGRQIGLPAMNAIWKGALYSGYFPLNNQQLCFHEGCLQYKGQPEWIEATINGPDNAFTMATSFNSMMSRTATQAATPAAMTGMYANIRAGGALRGYRGLGAIAGVPEAVVLVDQYLIPANQRDNPAWLVPRNSLEHQILYDVADAWLATKHPELNSTPYVAAAPKPLQTFVSTPPPAPPTLRATTQPVPVAMLPAPAVTPAAVSSGTAQGGGAPVTYYSSGGTSVVQSGAAPAPAAPAAAPAAASAGSLLPIALAALALFH